MFTTEDERDLHEIRRNICGEFENSRILRLVVWGLRGLKKTQETWGCFLYIFPVLITVVVGA